MKPLRLAMVAERFWPRVGSLETRAAGLACELADRGVEVTVVTARWRPEWPQEIYYHGLPIERLSPPPASESWRERQGLAPWLGLAEGWPLWNWPRSLARWLKRNEDHFDVVLVWGMLAGARAAIEALESSHRRPRVPVLLVPERTGWHGDCFRQVRIAGGKRIERACRRAAAFISTGPAVRRELEAAGYPRGRIRDVPPGVSLLPPRTAVTQTDARELLADANTALGLASRAPLVVSTTRLAADRGWELLLAAWSSVARQRPAARLWLAGEAPRAEEVFARIQWQGLSGSVSMLGKFDEVAQLLAAADLLVAPAPDGGPQSILEAMAAAMPAVAIDVPANRWLLGGGTAGLLVPPDDATALAEAMLRALGDVELAQRLGGSGRERAVREFSMSAMADGFCAVMDEVRASS